MLVCAIMIPIAMQIVVATSTTTWNSAVVVMWQVLIPVLMIIGVAILFITDSKGEMKSPLLLLLKFLDRLKKDKHAVGMVQVVGIIVGFVVVAISTPVAFNYLYSINSTFNASGTAATYSAVFTIFSILLPVLYMIGVAIKFVPHGK
jgi:hypothetical protein